MNYETESGWDEVESLVSMSDATICSNQNDTASNGDSQDIDNDPGIAIVQDNEMVIQEDSYKQDEQQDELSLPHKQKSIEGFDNETKIPELQGSSLNSNEEVKVIRNENNNDSLNPINDKEFDLQHPNDVDPAGEKSSGEEENLEPDEMLDGGAAEELPFVRSVKYLEKHEIFRLFQSLAADIVYQRPDNPLQFIVDKLEKDNQESQANAAKDTNSNKDGQPS